MEIPVFRPVEARPYTSPEKVANVVLQLRSQMPSSATEGMLLMVVRQFSGKLLDELPDDPQVLDDVLEQLAAYVLQLRSDPAPVEGTATEVV